MIRCPTCGVRIPDDRPVCPRHGEAKLDPIPSHEDEEEDVAVTDEDENFELEGFEIDKVLGKGGFGIVYKARRASDGAECAIKVAIKTNRSAIEALEAEAEAMDVIGSPAVPEVFARGRMDDGNSYLVLEFVRAPVMSDVLSAKADKYTLEEFFPLADTLLAAVEGTHAHGYIHRDLKPENVFIDEGPKAQLFDFGLVMKEDPNRKADEEGSLAGTPEYMAPEMCEGAPDLDRRADVYAVGVMLYELLAGHPPFHGPDAEVREAHRSRRPPTLTRVVGTPAPVAAVIARSLIKDKKRRWASVTEMRAALAKAKEKVESAPKPKPEPEAKPEAADAGAEAAPADEEEGKAGRRRGRRARGERSARGERAARGERSSRGGDRAARASRRKAGKAGGSAGGGAKERRTVGLIWFESRADLSAIQGVLADTAGQLAHTESGKYVAAFGHEVGDNPVRNAMNAARALVGRGLAPRAIVDVASVIVRSRPDGSRRYMSPLFSQADRFPQEGDPEGTLITATASELVPETPTEAGPRENVLVTRSLQESTQVTSIWRTEQPFIGHEKLLESVFNSARNVVHGKPTIVTIIADIGYGKSQLASVFATQMPMHGIPLRMHAMRALEPMGEVGHTTVRDLARRLLEAPEERPEDGGMALFKARLGDELAEEVRLGLSLALTWMEPDDPELASLSAAPGAIRAATASAVGKVLRHEAARTPIAILLDDAQFADETALDALEYATLEEGGARIWVCLLGRPRLQKSRPTFGDRAAHRLSTELPALDDESAGKLIRTLLHPARNVPDKAIQILVERTQGIPLLIVELVRGLRRDGVLRPAERGSGWYLATDELERLPDLPLVQWLATREIEALPKQLAAHAKLAATLGPTFTEEELEGLLQQLELDGVAVETDLDATVGIRRLRSAGFVVKDRTGRSRYRHTLLRDSLYASVPDELKNSAHTSAYGYYTERDDLPEVEKLGHLAFHAARSGQKEQAASAYLQLADRSKAHHAYLEAEMMFKEALENMPEDDARRVPAIWGRGLMRFRLGRNEDALKDLETAREYSKGKTEREVEVEILLDAATVLDWMDDHKRARALVEEADQLSTEAKVRSDLIDVRLTQAFGRSKFRFSEVEEGCDLMMKAAERAEPMGDAGYETMVTSLLLAAAGIALLGQMDESKKAFDKLLVTCEEHGDQLHLAAAYQNRCFVWMLQSDLEPLIADLNKMIEISRETGFPILEGRALYNLAEIAYLSGDMEAAHKHAERSIELHAQLMGPGGRTLMSQLLLARVKLLKGDLSGARATLDKLKARQEEARAQGRDDAELLPSDQVLFDLVELATREAGEGEWDTLLERSKEESVQQEHIEVLEIRGLAAMRAGDQATARSSLEAAIEVANEIPNVMGDRLRGELEDVERKTA